MPGETTVDWMDGSPVEPGPEQGEISHTYEEDGPHSAKVCDADEPDKCTTVDFEIPFEDGGEEPGEPQITAEADPADTTSRTAAITLTGFPADSPISVAWGDESADEELPAGTTEATHAYAETVTSEVTITATATADETVTASTTFTPGGGVEPAEPTAEAVADESDTTGRTARLTWSGFPEGATVAIAWGDGSAPQTGQAAEGEATHAYGEDATGEMSIVITSEQDETVTATATFTPTGGGVPGPTVTAQADEADTTGRTVQITIDGFAVDSALSVTWSEGGEAENLAAGTTEASHAYPADVTGEQVITVSTAEGETASATFTPGSGGEEPQEPSITAEADATDTTGRTVQIALAGFPADSDVSVAWGDDTEETVVPAGETEASHAYAETVSGEQTITATAVADETVTATATFTPGQGGQEPAPTVTAEADSRDTTGRTVIITVAGFPEGEEARVDWGDATQEQSIPTGQMQATHEYAADATGEMTITVTAASDPSITASATFTPGGGQEGEEPAPARPRRRTRRSR